PRSEKPSPRAAVTLGVVLLWVLPACTATPLDATLLQNDGKPIVTDVPKCVSAEPEVDHVYAISSRPTGRCLRSGEVTNIEGAPALTTGYTIELVECAGTSDQKWLLLGTEGQLEIQHVDLELNLDLEGGDLYDGTEALLYEPHGLRNQQFWLNPVADGSGSQEIRAYATGNSCLQAMLEGENAVELQGCPSVATRISFYQNWFFSEVEGVDCQEQ
ncbi:MAG TPA: hypothetical protein VNN80_34740, partial [Polyangiaceae bacterium]|nr:hypothetical protein [Polyangiaceae bacterium]